MGLFRKRQSTIAYVPADNPPAHKPVKAASPVQATVPVEDYAAEGKDAMQHAGLTRGWNEKPISVAGVRQHKDQLLMLSQKVIDTAPAWVIADPTPDNPDAMRVEALGFSIGTIPKAMSKRIRKLGERVPAMVLLNASNYDYHGQNTGAAIRAEVVVKGIR
jgi:hypothetical protein